MGPTCEVLLESDSATVLDAIDAVLASSVEHIERTRKGRVWDPWIGGRPVHVEVEGPPPSVILSAMCNGPEDGTLLQRLAESLAEVLGGLATPAW